MKRMTAWFALVLVMTGLFLAGCNKKGKKANIPDTAELIANITWLDSLTRSPETDSIGLVDDSLTICREAYRGRAQSGDDKAILDSLEHIQTVVFDYIRFCTDSRANLELLRQDIRNTESSYRSGRITVEGYISALLEDEQVLNDMLETMLTKRQKALIYLHSKSLLVRQLTPLTSFYN